MLGHSNGAYNMSGANPDPIIEIAAHNERLFILVISFRIKGVVNDGRPEQWQ